MSFIIEAFLQVKQTNGFPYIITGWTIIMNTIIKGSAELY